MVPTDVASHVLFHFEWGLSQCANLKSPSGDQRPHVELTIHWSLTSVQRVMVDIGAECSLVHGKPEQFNGHSAYTEGYGGQNIEVKAVSLPLEIG